MRVFIIFLCLAAAGTTGAKEQPKGWPPATVQVPLKSYAAKLGAKGSPALVAGVPTENEMGRVIPNLDRWVKRSRAGFAGKLAAKKPRHEIRLSSRGGPKAKRIPHSLADKPDLNLILDTGGHMASIETLSFTSDGRQLISAGDDKVIRVWDIVTGKTIRIIRGATGPGRMGMINAVALSSDNKWLAAAGWTGNRIADTGDVAGGIRIYDFPGGTQARLLQGHKGPVNSLAFSPDGKKIVSASDDHTAMIWDLEDHHEPLILEGHSDTVNLAAFLDHGASVVTASDDMTLSLWNASTGKLLAKMPGHNAKVRALDVSPDGNIASGDQAGVIRLWDGSKGKPQKVFAKQETAVGSLSFSKDGLLLVSCPGAETWPYRVIVWEVASGQRIAEYEKHDDIVLAAAFSPKTPELVATGGGANNEIHLWDARTGNTKAILKGRGSPIWAVGFSADGKKIAWGRTRTSRDDKEQINNRGPLEFELTILDKAGVIRGPQPVSSQSNFVRAQETWHEFSLRRPDSVSLDILKDGIVIHTIKRNADEGDDYQSYSFSPDGTIISGGGNGELTVYDRNGIKTQTPEFIGHLDDVWAITTSPDGQYLVSGSDDETVRLWNLKTRELLVTLFQAQDGAWVMWTPEGFYIGSKGTARIVGWQINQGPDKEARYVTAAQLRKVLFRPDLVAAKIAGDPNGLLKSAVAKLSIEELLKSSLAPEVVILSPADGSILGDANVSVSVRVSDQGGGVGVIRFRLNGQVVDSFVAGKPGTFDRPLDLGTSDTKIEVIAEDKSGKVQSLSPAVTVHADPKAVIGVPDLYILAIAADRYHEQSKRLNFSVNDADDLSKILKEAGAGFYRHPPIVKTLFDDDVTSANVEAAFKELSGEVKATDVFLFYMAGHGKSIDGDYHFLPPSMDGFSDEEIKTQGFGPAKLSAWFETIKAQKAIWILDTCESGSAEKVFGARDATADNAAYQRLKDATGRTIFMAAGEQQIALEGYGNHGLFTYALLEGFAKAGAGDKVQLFDLADYVETRVPELSRELKACDAKGPSEYCQKPIVQLGETPNYPLAPRYPKVLAMLGEKTPQVSTKPTHVVMQETALFASRGTAPSRQMRPGEQVTVIKTDDNFAQIAENGKLLGYVDKTKLLKLID
ncbi:MAG: caspase family protein [Rhodomicrobium sp.]